MTPRGFQNNIILCCFGLVLAGVFGCSSNKYLEEGEYFLESNDVRIRSDEKVKNKGTIKDDLEALYEQQETRTFIGIPRHWFYYQTRENPDSAWLKGWIQRKIADPPVIYDSTLAVATSLNMVRYLNNRGYLNATAEFETQFDKKRARVLYEVDPHKVWTIRSLEYFSQDTAIQKILISNSDKALLKPGEPINIELYTQEKERLTRLIQNNGYATFYQNYIAPLKGDSSDYAADVRLEVLLPPDSTLHKKYRIGRISVYPDYNTSTRAIRSDTIVDGIQFYPLADRYQIRPRIIAQKIRLREGDLYSRDAYDQTIRLLSRLEAYRFVSVKPLFDTLREDVINYQVFLTRNKKMTIGGEVELNYSTLSLSRRSLMGTAFNLNFRDRNIFNGAEVFTSSIESGIELNLRKTDSLSQLVNSFNLNIQNILFIPRFNDLFGMYHLLNRIRIFKHGLLSDRALDRLENGSTRYQLGYDRLVLFNFYRYHSLNFNLGYEMQSEKRRLLLDHIGVDLFLPDRIEPAFDSILVNNTFLKESFGKQFFTGFLFRGISSTYTSIPDRIGFSYSLIRNIEISGLEIFAVNTLYNQLTGQNGELSIGRREPIEFSQYAKIDFGSRFYLPINDKQSFAFRLDGGIAFPYGPFSEQVPYVKQFYLGGPLSIRAWQIRELGPGSYEDPNVDPNSSLPFYQTGDIKIEFSAEYRTDLFWIFKGALFLDAGNVWTLRKSDERPGAHFTRNFLNDIAIGTGVGLRMDFNYFLIRLDFGYKLRQPFEDEEGRKWLFHNFENFSLNQFNINFALGYPF